MRMPGWNREDRRATRDYRIAGQPVVLLIGSGEMPTVLTQMLVKGGFDLAGVHSPDAPLRTWTELQGLNYFEDINKFREYGETIAYDYLFSVLNFRVLPKSLVESPLEFAINYHDAPLPRYAGSHATAWALHNGETTHGITWHVMTEKVDAGDILQQVTFPITPAMTKDTLDARCALAGLRGFAALLKDLKTGTVTRVPQDLSQRTFYARASLPDAHQ